MSDRPAIEGGPPVRQELLVFGAPVIREEDIREVVKTLRSGWIGTGPKVAQFEDAFRRYVGARHAIALSSCSAALELALEVLGIGTGDEVLTTPITFPATANVIVSRGAKPVFIDVERTTMNLDPAGLERALSPRTRAIIPVHCAGQPCAMPDMLALANRRRLAVIEDAAHALEAAIDGRKIGTLSDFTCFSFYVTKNVTTVEGGMVTTARDDWAAELRLRSQHGISTQAWQRFTMSGFQPYDTVYAGHKATLTDVQASLGLGQLARVEENLRTRDRLWARYVEALHAEPALTLPVVRPGIRHARHLFIVLLNLEQLRITRNHFAAALRAEGIGCGIHFTALHLHSFYRKTFGYAEGDCPNAEWISERTLSLPLTPQLSATDVDDVVTAVRKLLRYYAG